MRVEYAVVLSSDCLPLPLARRSEEVGGYTLHKKPPNTIIRCSGESFSAFRKFMRFVMDTNGLAMLKRGLSASPATGLFGPSRTLYFRAFQAMWLPGLP